MKFSQIRNKMYQGRWVRSKETEGNTMQFYVKVQVLETCFLREKEWSIRVEQSHPICCVSGKETRPSGGFTLTFSTTKCYIHLCKTLQEPSAEVSQP